MDMEIGEPDKRSRTLWILIALIALSSVTTVEASRGGQSRSRDRDNGRHQPVTSSQTPDRRVRPADNGNHGNGQPNNGDRNEDIRPGASSQTPNRRVRPTENGNQGNGQPNDGDKNEGIRPVTSSQTPNRRVRPTENGNQGNGQPNDGDKDEEDTRPEFVNMRMRNRKQSGKNGLFPGGFQLAFSLQQKDLLLDLTWNRHMDDTAEVIIGYGPGKNNMKRWQSKKKGFAVYTDQKTMASIITREDTKDQRKLQYLGSFYSDYDEYVIEPADWSMSPLMSENMTDDMNIHMIHKIKQTPPEEQYDIFEKPTYITPANYQFSARGEDVSANVIGQMDYGVQVLVVIDYALYEKWFKESLYSSDEDKMNDAIDNIRFYFAHVMNGVDMRYRSIDDPDYMIHVTLGGYYIAATQGAAPFTQQHLTPGKPRGQIDTYSAINTLVEWLDDNKDVLPLHDQATLYTSDYLISKYSGNRILGLANIHGMCTRYGVSLNRDAGLYSATQTGAHEMGHNLGAYHDGDGNDCRSQDQYIMATNPVPLTDSTFKNAFNFSPCSIKAIKNQINTLNKDNNNCLLDETIIDINITELLGKLPGEKYTPDEQCRIIFGEESFFCGGATEEKVICRSMECFDTELRYCRTSAELRAVIGTSCGNKKWCDNGDCVYNINARSMPDYCFYGDYSGPYKNGLSCYIIGTQKPWHCYNDYYLDDCCETCGNIKDPTRPECPYGDKDETCVDINPEMDCWDPEINTRCCHSCESFIIKPETCVDEASWCPEYIKSGSSCYYDMGKTCCASCKQFETGIEGCTYGDKASWCQNYIVKGSSCYRGYDLDCCATCYRFYTGIPGCEFGDREGCDGYVTARDCYTQDTVCCDTCRGLVISDNAYCRYGDKEEYCLGIHPSECYSKSEICCFQCPLYATGIEGCEYGDRIQGCTQSDCSDPGRMFDCCDTCQQIRTTPDPWCVDEASWCTDLHPSYCYGQAKDVCCQRCASQYTGKSGCEYGDRHVWCEAIYCQSPALRQECCESCSSDPSPPTTAMKTTTTTMMTTTTTTTAPTTSTTTTTTTTTTPPSQICKLRDASWCSDSRYRVWPRDCIYYSEDGACCNLCQQYYSGDPNCPFGDQVNWCPGYIFSPDDCYQDISDICCQTCKDVS